MFGKLALAAVSLFVSASAFAGNNREINDALINLQQARQQMTQAQSNLDQAQNALYRALNSDSGKITCRGQGSTSYWRGEYIGEGNTENEARDALVQDCLRKYPGPKDIVCPNWRGASDVICRRE